MDLPTLQSLSAMLARYVYHFSNGDRHQLAFRHVRTFQRELARLVHDAEDEALVREKLGRAVASGGEKGKVGIRVRRWREEGRVGEWFVAFSQMMVDSNAAKAVFLIAVLAEVAAVVGVVAPDELKGSGKGSEELAEGLGLG